MASLSSFRTKSQKMLPEGLSVVPTVAADVSTTDSWIFQITMINTTAGALTFTILDKQSVPKGPTSISVAANTIYIMQWQEGLKMLKGINWVASGAGMVAEIVGTYL